MMATAAALIALLATTQQAAPKTESVGMKKLTPMLAVESIEAELPFWTESLGFARTMQVPDEGPLVFVALENNGLEVMLQTLASIKDDVPALAEGNPRGALYVEVESLAAAEARLGDAESVVPRRETFYGATEVVVRSPAGHVVVLAEMKTASGEKE